MDTANEHSFDYSYVPTPARVALYDDLKSAPRITVVDPAKTNEFIEKLTATIDEQAKFLGGKIPYTAIREVAENFIHAQFKDIVVSILDEGNTIRFADQGPGIPEKEKAKKPGFTSATEPMKDYIRGVGSGLPIVNEWISDRFGSVLIEDNLTTGSVITISLVKHPQAHRPVNISVPSQNGASFTQLPHIPLSNREQTFLKYLYTEGQLGITEFHEITDVPVATIHSTLNKLEQACLVKKTPNKKRYLTELGQQVSKSLF